MSASHAAPALEKRKQEKRKKEKIERKKENKKSITICEMDTKKYCFLSFVLLLTHCRQIKINNTKKFYKIF